MHDIDSLLKLLLSESEPFDFHETDTVEQRFVDLCQQLEHLDTDEQVESARNALKEYFGIHSLHPYLVRQVAVGLRAI